MHLLASRWAQALGWSLVDFLWQGMLLGLLTAALLRALRNAPGRVRYAMACLALLACLLVPFLGTLGHLEAPAPWLAATPADAMHVMIRIDAAAAPRSLPWSVRLDHLLRLLVTPMLCLWSLGCLAMGARTLGGWLWLRRLRLRGDAASRELCDRLRELSARLGIRRSVRLSVVPSGTSPLTYGLWRPVILVPFSCLMGLSPDHLEALLAHELAHAARWDHAVNLLQTVAEVLLFFHPAVWWISRRIRTEREFLCDDLAAKALGDPRRLALALNALDDLQPRPNLHVSTALAADGGPLLNRIERLIRPADPLRGSLPWVLPTLLALALGLPLAARALGDKLPASLPMPAELVRQVDDLADREGIDRHLLRAIAFAESRFNPTVKSSSGALGLLQVMPATARKYGAQDLTDPVQVAAAGARYLRFLLERYAGDRSKAVSAYKAGEEALDAGRLTEETLSYTPEVLRLAEAQCITAEGPLSPDALEGRLERWRDGSFILNLRFLMVRPAMAVDILPETGDKPLASLRIGSTEPQAPSGDLEESRPKIRFEAPGVRRLRLRVSEPGKPPMGEHVLSLDMNLQAFRLRLD